MTRTIVVAVLAAAAGATVGVHPATPAGCGSATALRGAPIVKLGPLMVAGFASDRCAAVRLGCGPQWQASLSLELPTALKSRIVLRATGVKLVLVSSTTPSPKIPRCLSGRTAQDSVTLKPPDQYFVLFVFASKNVTFRLSASRGGRSLGAVAIAAVR